MSDTNSKDSGFYIGWQEHAPSAYAGMNRRFIGVVIILVVLSAGLLVFSQQGFVNSTFELGRISTHEGILVKKPVPMLKIPTGTDERGKAQFKSILLIGFGKSGAEATVAAIESAQGQDLDGQSVQLRGTLIYYRDKTALELTEGVESFVGLVSGGTNYAANRTTLEELTSLRGEILDPKCALGVMKPGYGKPHRSCAIRCISGGVPPVLRVTNPTGENNYCVVVGKDGQKVNAELLDFVADQVQICGRLEKQDDWLILYTDPEKDISQISSYWLLSDGGEVPMCQ